LGKILNLNDLIASYCTVMIYANSTGRLRRIRFPAVQSVRILQENANEDEVYAGMFGRMADVRLSAMLLSCEESGDPWPRGIGKVDAGSAPG
jgi:hypothetical protein